MGDNKHSEEKRNVKISLDPTLPDRWIFSEEISSPFSFGRLKKLLIAAAFVMSSRVYDLPNNTKSKETSERGEN